MPRLNQVASPDQSSISRKLIFHSFFIQSKKEGEDQELIRAATCDFHQCGILTTVDSDEPVQPPFKLRNSKWCSVSSLTIIEYSSD